MVMFVPVDQQGFNCFRTEPAHSKALLCGFSVCSFQYGNVGAMAITLCQSLGQNIGMRWNNARNSAGKGQLESRTAQGERIESSIGQESNRINDQSRRGR